MSEIDRRTLATVLAASMIPGSAVAADEAATSAARAGSTPTKTGRFDLAQIAATFPETSDTLLVDQYLSDTPHASCRLFRIYKPVPPHFHRQCDEFLYVFQGRGTFWMGDASTKAEFAPGQLLYFERLTVHSVPEIIEGPVVFLSVDTPRRDPKDITFVDPKDGTPESFIKQNKPEPY